MSSENANCTCHTHPLTGNPSTRERSEQCPVHSRADKSRSDDEEKIIRSILSVVAHDMREAAEKDLRDLLAGHYSRVTNTQNIEVTDEMERAGCLVLDRDPDNIPAAYRAMHALARSSTSQVRQGEVLWLIETSRLAQPNGPQRHFYTGDPRAQWHFSALKAARYPTKEAAEHVAEDAGFYPRSDYPVLDHAFNCGTMPEDSSSAIAGGKS